MAIPIEISLQAKLFEGRNPDQNHLNTFKIEKIEQVGILVNKARLMRKTKPVLQEVKGESKSYFINGISTGEIIGNRFKVLEILDSGATGNVHKAIDMQNGNLVALKSLREGVHKNTFIRRFIREAGALSVLNHKNIVGIEDLGWDNNKPYIAMEYVTGGNFKKLITMHHAGQVNLNTMLHLLADLCDGLNHLHDRPNSIIHRDLKPENILISNETSEDYFPKRNVLKIADLGLALIYGNTLTTLTYMDRPIMGTPNYSPIPDHYYGYALDNRSDLYSLGIIIYEVLMKKLPFTSPDNDLNTLLYKHLHEKPDFSSISIEAPARLIALTEKLLAKKPEDRYQSAKEVALELRDIATPRFSIPIPQIIQSMAG